MYLSHFNISKLTGKISGFDPAFIFKEGSQIFDVSYFWGALEINDWIGKKVSIIPSGQIFCISTGEKIKKSYQQGYSYKATITLPECDICMVRPELCHFMKGTCRDEKWGMQHCFRPHVIYLANTGDLKVGITRNSHFPARWIDQGAIQVLPIGVVKDRLTAGNVEIELAKVMSDKTKWQLMLSSYPLKDNLSQTKEDLIKQFEELLKKYELTVLPNFQLQLNYPVTTYPEKLTSLSLDDGKVEGILLGIKGQYFIFDTGVLNIRKFQGYEITLEVE